METRNKGIFKSGFYKNLINLNDEQRQFHTNEQQINLIKKRPANFNNLIKSINYNILTKLNSSRKSATTIMFKIVIDMKTYKYLQTAFNFNAKFRENELFMQQFQIKTSRCTNIKYSQLAQNFHFKICKGRKLKYGVIDDNEVLLKTITDQPRLCVQFFKISMP